MQLVPIIAAGAYYCSWCLLLQLVPIIAAGAYYCSWCLLLQLVPIIAVCSGEFSCDSPTTASRLFWGLTTASRLGSGTTRGVCGPNVHTSCTC